MVLPTTTPSTTTPSTTTAATHPTADWLEIIAWTDPVIDDRGYDPRSTYVEQFWLGILGPSSIWLLRHLAERLEAEPTGFTLDVTDCAGALGLGSGAGRNAPVVRTIGRCCQFGAAQRFGTSGLAVRRKLPPLTRHHAERLPQGVQLRLQAWQQWELRIDPTQRMELRARRLALSLLQAGEDFDGALRQLLAWQVHPTAADAGLAWAWNRATELTFADDAAEPTARSSNAVL